MAVSIWLPALFKIQIEHCLADDIECDAHHVLSDDSFFSMFLNKKKRPDENQIVFFINALNRLHLHVLHADD